MATNGWYVEKIITDLQSGKVDEFVKKEGKWFNYLKGEATTFTNAADAGSASGNLDFEEFSIQGIGTISGTPFVSGTTPVLGGNIVISVEGGVDWTSTGFSSYNISALPSTGTFTIIPDNGNTVAASQFSALAVILPSYIDSITFADTHTAYSNSNTVVATINFDGSSLSSGTTTTFNLVLNPVAVASGVVWEGVIGLLGNFDTTIGLFQGSPANLSSYENINSNPGTYIGAGNVTLNTASSVNAEIYNASAVIIPNETSTLLDFTFTANGSIFYDPNIPPIVQINVPNEELSQYSISHDDSGGIFVRRVIVSYVPEEGMGAIDDDNVIDIFTNSQVGICKFNSTNLNASPGGWAASVPITNNLGDFSITVTYPDGTNAWLSNNGTTYSGDSSIIDHVQVSANANDTGIAREATLRVTSDTNTSGTPNDTLTITQQIANSINIYGQFEVLNPDYVWAWGVDPSTEFITVGYTGNGGGEWTDVGFLGTTTSEGTNYKLAANHNLGFRLQVQATFQDETADYWGLDSDGWAIIDPETSEAPTWINQSGSIIGEGMLDTNFQVTTNEGSFERTAEFTYIHPDDNTMSTSFTVKQVGSYDPGVHTFQFKTISGELGNGTAVFTASTEDGVYGTFVVGNSEDFIILYGLYPLLAQDLGTYNASNSVSYLAATVSDSGYPLPWYENLDMGDNFATIEQIDGVEEGSSELGVGDQAQSWIYNLSCDYTPDLQNIDPNTGIGTLVTDVNNKVRFIISENNNVKSQAGPYANFPIERTFTLKGFNPYNTTSSANDIIYIKQEAKPYVAFIYNILIVDGNYSEDDGHTANVKSNGTSAPTAKIFVPEFNMMQDDGSVVSMPAAVTTSNGWLSINSVGSAISSILDNQDNVVGKFWPVSFNVEENWTGNSRTANVAIWHSSITGDTLYELGTPTEAWGAHDLINFTQEPTIPYLTVSPDSEMTTLQNELAYGDPPFWQLLQLAFAASATEMYDQFMSLAFPISYNGSTPTIESVEYSDDSTSNVLTSVASITSVPWVPSASVSNTEVNVSINHLSQNPSTTRALAFKLTHSNGSLYTQVSLIFQLP